MDMGGMDSYKNPRISIIAPAGSSGFPFYIGTCFRFFEANLDEELPKPVHMAGTSGGAPALASIVPWTRENFQRVIDITRKLKPSEIYNYSPFLVKRLGTIAALNIADHFIEAAFKKIIRKPENDKVHLLLKGAEISLDIALEAAFLHQFMNTPSLFSSDPLLKLLETKLDFEGIFNSDIKLDIVSTDSKSGRRVVYTNYLPQDKDIKVQDRNQRFLKGLVASASIPGLFPPITEGGMELVDGGVLTSVPLRESILADADIILLLLYKNLEDLGDDAIGRSAIENLHGCWCITTHEAARRNVKGFMMTNENLAVLEELKKFIKNNIGTEKELTESELIIKKFSFSQKKRIPIILVQADEKVPDKGFRKFNERDLTRSMEIGYRAMQNAIPQIKKHLNM